MSKNQATAIYLRLSAGDHIFDAQDEKQENRSISSQRTLLLEYIRMDQNLSQDVIEEFCEM